MKNSDQRERICIGTLIFSSEKNGQLIFKALKVPFIVGSALLVLGITYGLISGYNVNHDFDDMPVFFKALCLILFFGGIGCFLYYLFQRESLVFNKGTRTAEYNYRFFSKHKHWKKSFEDFEYIKLDIASDPDSSYYWEITLHAKNGEYLILNPSFINLNYEFIQNPLGIPKKPSRRNKARARAFSEKIANFLDIAVQDNSPYTLAEIESRKLL